MSPNIPDSDRSAAANREQATETGKLQDALDDIKRSIDAAAADEQNLSESEISAAVNTPAKTNVLGGTPYTEQSAPEKTLVMGRMAQQDADSSSPPGGSQSEVTKTVILEPTRDEPARQPPRDYATRLSQTQPLDNQQPGSASEQSLSQTIFLNERPSEKTTDGETDPVDKPTSVSPTPAAHTLRLEISDIDISTGERERNSELESNPSLEVTQPIPSREPPPSSMTNTIPLSSLGDPSTLDSSSASSKAAEGAESASRDEEESPRNTVVLPTTETDRELESSTQQLPIESGLTAKTSILGLATAPSPLATGVCKPLATAAAETDDGQLSQTMPLGPPESPSPFPSNQTESGAPEEAVTPPPSSAGAEPDPHRADISPSTATEPLSASKTEVLSARNDMANAGPDSGAWPACESARAPLAQNAGQAEDQTSHESTGTKLGQEPVDSTKTAPLADFVPNPKQAQETTTDLPVGGGESRSMMLVREISDQLSRTDDNESEETLTSRQRPWGLRYAQFPLAFMVLLATIVLSARFVSLWNPHSSAALTQVSSENVDSENNPETHDVTPVSTDDQSASAAADGESQESTASVNSVESGEELKFEATMIPDVSTDRSKDRDPFGGWEPDEFEATSQESTDASSTGVADASEAIIETGPNPLATSARNEDAAQPQSDSRSGSPLATAALDEDGPRPRGVEFAPPPAIKSEQTLPGASSPAAAFAETKPPLRIQNPDTNRGEVNFIVNGLRRSLKPGQSLEFHDATSWVVEFHRGGTFGIARYSFPSGSFSFHVSKITGWDIQRDKPEEFPAQP